MREARYIYGCSTSESFTVALGRAAKIDTLAKVDVKTLISRGIASPPETVKGCVDSRTIRQIARTDDPEDPIRLFQMLTGWYAQEPRFVPRSQPRSEDDGWLLTYVFDESQLDERGACRHDAKSELWVIDAREMRDVVAKVKLPERVPYGLHGAWFSEEDIRRQRPYQRVRSLSHRESRTAVWKRVRDFVERRLG